MMKLNEEQAGKTLAVVFAVIHFASTALRSVTGGWSTRFMMEMHQTAMAYNILPLTLYGLVVGTVLAAILGFVIGAMFAYVWNAFDSEKKKR